MRDIPQLFNQFDDLNVLVVGDVMIDRYLRGKVERISPEAPVPVVHLQSAENRLGGAANVALNLKALGATPYLCSLIGEDENAHNFRQLMEDEQLSLEGILSSTYRNTTVKTRIIASNQQILRVDREDAIDLLEEEGTILLNQIKSILDSKDIHLIIFQDYNKGVLSETIIHSIMLEAIDRDIPTTVDPKRANFFSYKKVDLFKPNLKEVQDVLPFTLNPTLVDLHKASTYLREKLGHRYTMITLSDKGIFIDDGEKQEIVPTQIRKIADVCGAGDTVISVASLGLGLQLSLQDMARICNVAGGQVCEKVGVVPVNKQEFMKELLEAKYPYLM